MFSLDKRQKSLLAEWNRKKDLTKYSGCCGGRFTFSFTPTTLGLVTKVYDNLDKDSIDLTDYDKW